MSNSKLLSDPNKILGGGWGGGGPSLPSKESKNIPGCFVVQET